MAYSITAVPEKLRWVYLLNPLTPPLEGMRASSARHRVPGRAVAGDFHSWAARVLLAVGLFAFKRMERSFADVI